MKLPLAVAHILLIDDHAMFRSGLRMLLAAEMPSITLIEASTVNDALQSTECAIDVVLLDIKLHNTNGLDGIDAFKTKWPQAHILMLSAQDDGETRLLVLARGADGFLSKTETADTMINTIHTILCNKTAGQHTPKKVVQKTLTPRQSEVLNLLQQGLSNKRIASELALSDNTVRRHVQDILEYFNVSNRSEAVFAARNQQILA